MQILIYLENDEWLSSNWFSLTSFPTLPVRNDSRPSPVFAWCVDHAAVHQVFGRMIT